jgi:hypothetical protein
MEDSGRQFKYEVAFSFLKEDEQLAESLNDLIGDRLSTFLYSKRQGEVAGRDGEALFNRVFGKESRIVVILYREGWGQTPWTRIEETAIKNRAFDSGYEFVVLISLTKPATKPPYIPQTYLYVGFDRFGKEGAAAVIENRVATAGGNIRAESAVDHALRVHRKEEYQAKRGRFLGSEAGVQAADRDAVALVNFIESAVEKIRNQSGLKMRFMRFDHRSCEIHFGDYCIAVGWVRQYINTLDGAYLSAQLCRGFPPRPNRVTFEDPKYLKKLKIRFDIDESDVRGWREGDSKQSMDANELAEFIVHLLLRQVETDG